MFADLPRKRCLWILALCILNSLFGIFIGLGIRYIDPPEDVFELRTKVWDIVGRHSDEIQRVIDNGIILPRDEQLVRIVFLLVQGEIIVRGLSPQKWETETPWTRDLRSKVVKLTYLFVKDNAKEEQ